MENESYKLPWYHAGLRFSCTACGKCCTGSPGAVWVDDEDIAKMAAAKEMDVFTFTKKYTRNLNGRRTLLEDENKNYDCVFLRGKECSLYESRPKQCRTFPWWPQNLESRAAWDEAAKDCEGIHEEASLVPYEDIVSTLESV